MSKLSKLFGRRQFGPAYGSRNVRKVLAALKRHGVEWPGDAEDTYIARQEDARGVDAWHWYLVLDTRWANDNAHKVPQVGGRNPVSTWPAADLVPFKNDVGCYEMC